MELFVVVSCSVEYFDVYHFTHVICLGILLVFGFTAAFYNYVQCYLRVGCGREAAPECCCVLGYISTNLGSARVNLMT